MNTARRTSWKWVALAAGVVLAGLGVALRVLLFAPHAEVVVVAEGALEEEVKGPGAVSSETEVTVSSRLTGVVERVLVQEGDHVKKGQLLVALDERDLSARAGAARSTAAAARQNVAVAEAALQKAEADLTLAQSHFGREDAVFRAGHLSQAALDLATAALRVAQSAEKNARAVVGAREQEARRAAEEARYADTIQTHAQLTAPLTGLVTRRQVEVGTTVVPGNTLFRLVDDQTVCVATRVDVSQMGRVRTGQRARIRLASGATASGSVVRISHEADPVTRDQEVRVRFEQPPAHLTLNEEAEVVISIGEARGLVVPGSALLAAGGVDGVLKVQDGRAVRAEVRVGATGQGKALVLSGLAAGDQVLAHPERFKPGQRVRALAGRE